MVNRKTIGAVILIFGALLLVAPLGLGVLLGTTNAAQVTCDITVRNPNGDLEISQHSCTLQEKQLCGNGFLPGIFTQSSILKWFLPKDRAELVLRAGGNTVSQEVAVDEFHSETYTLSTCTPKDQRAGSISLVGENSRVLDTKRVPF